jgi:hypothetical protein
MVDEVVKIKYEMKQLRAEKDFSDELNNIL